MNGCWGRNFLETYYHQREVAWQPAENPVGINLLVLILGGKQMVTFPQISNYTFNSSMTNFSVIKYGRKLRSKRESGPWVETGLGLCHHQGQGWTIKFKINITITKYHNHISWYWRYIDSLPHKSSFPSMINTKQMKHPSMAPGSRRIRPCCLT